MLVNAIPAHSAATQDEVCAAVAPRCRVASTMMASVPPNPTTAATSADAITENCNPGPPRAIVTRCRLTVTPPGAHRSSHVPLLRGPDPANRAGARRGPPRRAGRLLLALRAAGEACRLAAAVRRPVHGRARP